MADSVIRSRIDPIVKAEAARIFKDMGLTMSDAIRLFLHQTVTERALPFPVRLPNEETKAAIEEARKGDGLALVSLDGLKREWEEH